MGAEPQLALTFSNPDTMEATTLEYLSNPAAPVSLRDSLSPDPWPAVNGARALTRDERKWLESVPNTALVVILFGGKEVEVPYSSRLWQKKVQYAVEHRTARLRREGDWLVVEGLPSGVQKVNLLVAPCLGAGTVGGGHVPPAVSRVAPSGLPARPASFFRRKPQPGGQHGYVARGYKED